MTPYTSLNEDALEDEVIENDGKVVEKYSDAKLQMDV